MRDVQHRDLLTTSLMQIGVQRSHGLDDSCQLPKDQMSTNCCFLFLTVYTRTLKFFSPFFPTLIFIILGARHPWHMDGLYNRNNALILNNFQKKKGKMLKENLLSDSGHHSNSDASSESERGKRVQIPSICPLRQT